MRLTPIRRDLPLLAAALLVSAALGGAQTESPRTLELFRAAAGEAAAGALQRGAVTAGERLFLRVEPAADSWVVEQAFLSAAAASGAHVTLADSATSDLLVRVDAPLLRVRFGETWQDGLFGASFTRREARAAFRCAVATRAGGEIRFAGDCAADRADTVRVDEIAALETASLPSTHAAAPSGSFLDRVAEPFLIVGATGVAVYLLFNLRTAP